ncbi:TetR/AcrR family transcriptional regulator [Mycolicibacterium goodii]|uniref:TetR/AcrR family transcriptional regulator n=1 Tax=Mycolicibacterium goodii TaxID=134601 RepID=UPI001F03E597|nr:TetR/AcrR family transcriptional regulator [Mycolicibacterium goodii]ULN48386.1 TetR/AcrR family transcriptional regulator [Mycolicibacterium goodii]
MPKSQRDINPRGKGGQLRDEILHAAGRLLESSSRDAITLRGIAREAGIAAPSIYVHFADRDAVIDAVVTQAFHVLTTACESAYATAEASGAAKVRAVCAAYVRFASEHPAEYRTLFDSPRQVVADKADLPNATGQAHDAGLAAFRPLADALAAAVEDGSAVSADPELDAQALWCGVHGLLMLLSAAPTFPWRDASMLIERLVVALAGLRT